MKNNLKNLIGLPGVVLAVGSLAFFGLPWWMTAVGGFLAALLFPIGAGKAFSVGFAAGFSLWYGIASFFNFANNGVLAGKIGALFQGLQGWHLLTGTGAFGGLMAGLGALTGTYLLGLIQRDATA
jgi:hypothetical protein